MKKIDFKKYEKLNIDPINIHNLNDIDTEITQHIVKFYKKSDIKTFDITKIHDMYYMSFIKKDFKQYDPKPSNHIMLTDDGLFIKKYESDILDKNTYGWLYFKNYDEYLKTKDYDFDWDITEIYKCNDETVNYFWRYKPFECLDLTQVFIEKLIKDYKYIKYTIKLR